MGLGGTARGFSLRGLFLPLVLLGAILAVGLVVVVLSQTLGASDVPPKAPPFTAAKASAISVRDVKQKDGLKLTLIKIEGTTAVQQDVTRAAGATVERLTPILAADVRPGDQLTVFGIPNTVKNFSIRTVVVQSGGRLVDGVARSPSGFAGHEAAKDQLDRPILGGEVIGVEGNDIRVKGPNGTMIVRTEKDGVAKGNGITVALVGRLYRLEPGSADAIAEGDRIAANFEAQPLGALLLLPGDAPK